MFSAGLQLPGYVRHFLWKDRFLCSIVHTSKEKLTPSTHTPSVTFQLEPHSPGRTGFPVPSYTPQRRRSPTHTDQDGYTMGPPLRSQHAVPGCIWTLLMEGHVSLFLRTPTKTLGSHCFCISSWEHDEPVLYKHTIGH